MFRSCACVLQKLVFISIIFGSSIAYTQISTLPTPGPSPVPTPAVTPVPTPPTPPPTPMPKPIVKGPAKVIGIELLARTRYNQPAMIVRVDKNDLLVSATENNGKYCDNGNHFFLTRSSAVFSQVYTLFLEAQKNHSKLTFQVSDQCVTGSGREIISVSQ